MDEAIEGKSVHIVGLARPLTAEPYFVRDMVEGKSDGAKPNHVPSAIQTPASVAQIGAIGKGQDIPDLSNEDVAAKMVEGITGQKPENKPAPEQNTSASYEKSTEDKNGHAKI